MSSPEYEKFEMTAEDFDPIPKRKRMSKQQAALGIFADDSDEDEDEQRPQSSRRKGQRDYMAEVKFVSGGIKVGDKVTREEAEDVITDSDEDEPVQVRRKAFRQTFAGGVGKKTKTSDDIPVHMLVDDKVLKMMKGYVHGKGLGKNLQGISDPVKAKQRPGRAALGFYGSEKTEQAEKDFPKKPDSDEEEGKEFKLKMQRWKKGQPKKKTVTYQTAEELIASNTGLKRPKDNESDLAKVKVLDMTGKELRVLSGYHALSMKHDKPRDDDSQVKVTQQKLFDLPELLHNLDLLVDLSAEDIIKNDKKLKYERDMCVNLDHEHNRLVTICEEEEKQISRMTEIIDIVNKCEMCQRTGGLESLEECARHFAQLQKDYYVEYAMFDLSSVAVAIVFPLVKSVFDGWEPLQTPRQGLTMMKRWKEILEGDNQPTYNHGHMTNRVMTPYDQLVWETIVPHVRSAIMNKWNVRYPNALVDLLNIWRPLVPEWIMANILASLVFPKVQMEVENWNPLTDTMPIHLWIHPWLPMMGDRLEEVYIPIRQKLASALTKWHPSDHSAKLILQPWVAVFNPSHLSVFLTKNIVPKLALCMQEFTINPHQQELDAWHWVMAWVDIIPPVSMVKILTENFFPRWIRVLSSWLLSNPNFDEVTKWYLGWKSMFPDQLLSDVAIKSFLNEALEMMNHAVLTHSQPGARENVAYLTLTERRRDFEPDRKDTSLENATPPSLSLGFASVPSSVKECLEQRAEEKGILFMPMTNKTYEGRQVYRLGRIQVSIDKTVIHYLVNGQWQLTNSIDAVINKAE